MGELTIALILAASFAFAWWMPASDRRDEFLDARVFWWAVAAGVVLSALAWSLGAARSYFRSRGRR